MKRKEKLINLLMEDGYRDAKTKIENASAQLTPEHLLAMDGFVTFCREDGRSEAYISMTILHDIMGIADEDETFSPRTEDFAKYAKPTQEETVEELVNMAYTDFSLLEADPDWRPEENAWGYSVENMQKLHKLLKELKVLPEDAELINTCQED